MKLIISILASLMFFVVLAEKTLAYLAGLDHEAHDEGMGSYISFFKDTTDREIKKVIDVLKEVGEFDNKIFILIADHGHTAMPENMTLDEKDEAGNVIKTWTGDTSCSLNVKGFGSKKVQFHEKANNNLHIWELANFFIQFPSPDPGIMLRVLAPKQIADIAKGATADIGKANVIAAFNGPMSHIYVKGTDWQVDPDPKILDWLIVRLNNVFKEGRSAAGSLKKIIDDHFPMLSSSIDAILVRKSLSGEYEAVQDIGEDTQGKLVIKTVPLEQYLSQKSEYVEALTRIRGMNNENRSGDIVLIMKDNAADAPTQRYTTGVACKSWHGSLNKSDSYVPFILSYPGGNKNELDNLTNAICADNKCTGNWKLSEIIKKIVETQYSGQ